MKSKDFLIVFLSLFLVSCLPLSISPPTETPVSRGASADIPMYPEHSDVLVLGNGETFSYRAHTDLKTVTQFYQAEMVSQGWVQAQAPVTSDRENILYYKKDNQKVVINMIDGNGVTSVGIAVTP